MHEYRMHCTGQRNMVRCAGAATSPYQQLGIDGAWEFGEVTRRMTLSIACVAAVGLGGAALYAHGSAAPACDSNATEGAVNRVLHDQFHLQGVFLHDFTTVSGGFFSDTQDCVAQVAEIRGNVDAGNMPWRAVRYKVTRSSDPESPVVTVDLGKQTPFVPPSGQTWWTRLLAHL